MTKPANPARKLIMPRLRVQDARAASLEETVVNLPKPTMAHERAVMDLLIDRLTMLDMIDELYNVVEQLRIERADAYENASQEHQAAMAKLRGELAVIKSTITSRGKSGAAGRNAKLSPERRQEIARKAANTRWKKT